MRRMLILLLGLGSCVSSAENCVSGHGLQPDELLTLDLESLTETSPGRSLSSEYRLRDVRFVRQNVFPRTSHWLARQANRFHVVTRERALASAFILESGDSLDEKVRREAERVLREKPYLQGAAVLVRQICGASADLDIVTQDVWTLTPGIGISRSGGDNEISLSLSDLNIAGSGKSISVEVFDDRDRSGTALQYIDPNINGSRWAGRLAYADNDDGEQYGFALERPFFSLDSPWAFGVSASHASRDVDLEFLGADLYELDAEVDTADVFIARSSGRQSGWVSRLYAGFRFLEETYGYPSEFPGAATTREKRVYPYLAWQFLEDDFITTRNLERVGVTEDLRLGWSSYVEAGWSTESVGGDGDHLLMRGSLAYRRIFDERHLFSATAVGNGRYDIDDAKTEDLVAQASVELLWHQAEKWRLFTRARYVNAKNLALHRQLTLGGDTALRGYPARYQPGDRSFLLTVEQRYYSDAYPFGLFRLGYAAFLDIGRAWFEDEPPAWVPPRRGDHFDTLANVGVGLRLESTRTRRDRVFHIDVARALVEGPGVDDWEITLSGKQRF